MGKRKWTEENLREAVKQSRSVRQILSILGLREAGGNYSQIKKFLNLYGIDTTCLKGQAWNKGLKGIGKPLLELEEIMVKNSNFPSYKLKKRLFDDKIKEHKCEICGWAKRTEDGRLPLELDHINGDKGDNRLENLRILCPNCHSLQATHRGRNIKRK